MPAESKPQVLQAPRMACVNNAAFVMNFKVGYSHNGTNGETDGSGNYPINQTRTIDLKDKGLQAGDVIWPHVSAVAGLTKDGEKVAYAPNGQTVTYTVSGTTLIYDINRVGA